MGIVAIVLLLGVWIALRLTSSDEVSPSPVPAIVAQPVPLPKPVAPESQVATQSRTEPQTAIATPDGGSYGGVERRPSKVELTSPNVELRTSNTGFRIPSRASRPDHFDLALRYQNLGDFERAREQYLAVLAEDELNVEARNNLGLLYHGRGMTSDAIDEFRRAIAVNPRYARARGNLAVALMSAGRLAEARAELRAALDVAPGNVDMLVNMALVEKGDQHLERAIELLVRAVGTSPEHAVAHYNLAVLYEEHDSLALAFDHYNAFLKYAGPEHGSLITDVQRRALVLESKRQ
jgi:Tfp pilus assembly protein PilF